MLLKVSDIDKNVDNEHEEDLNILMIVHYFILLSDNKNGNTIKKCFKSSNIDKKFYF